jgi:hypothetical protein
MKNQLLHYLAAGNIEAVTEWAAVYKRTLSWLTGLSYHPDPSIANQAVEAFGPAAARIATHDSEYVRNHLRRLFWLLSDESGGIGWRAPELIAAAIAACPGRFDEFISPLVNLLDMEPEDAPRFRPSLLAGIARIADCRPEAVRFARYLLLTCLIDRDPGVQRQARDCLDKIK